MGVVKAELLVDTTSAGHAHHHFGAGAGCLRSWYESGTIPGNAAHFHLPMKMGARRTGWWMVRQRASLRASQTMTQSLESSPATRPVARALGPRTGSRSTDRTYSMVGSTPSGGAGDGDRRCRGEQLGGLLGALVRHGGRQCVVQRAERHGWDAEGGDV